MHTRYMPLKITYAFLAIGFIAPHMTSLRNRGLFINTDHKRKYIYNSFNINNWLKYEFSIYVLMTRNKSETKIIDIFMWH